MLASGQLWLVLALELEVVLTRLLAVLIVLGGILLLVLPVAAAAAVVAAASELSVVLLFTNRSNRRCLCVAVCALEQQRGAAALPNGTMKILERPLVHHHRFIGCCLGTADNKQF